MMMCCQRSFFLLSCEEISVVNHTTVARVFNDAMHILWPGGVKYDNLLLLLIDAAPYMIKAGEGLSVSYPKMIHVTCVAHTLHRVRETISVLYPNVDKLIANAKNVFVKSPSRLKIFKTRAPNTLSLPPRSLPVGAPGWMLLSIMQRILNWYILWLMNFERGDLQVFSYLGILQDWLPRPLSRSMGFSLQAQGVSRN